MRSEVSGSANRQPIWPFSWQSIHRFATNHSRVDWSYSVKSDWPEKSTRRPEEQDRLREAVKLGFSIALIPKSNAPKQPLEGLTVIGVERIDEAFDRIREL